MADAHGSGPCEHCVHEGSSPFSCTLMRQKQSKIVSDALLSYGIFKIQRGSVSVKKEKKEKKKGGRAVSTVILVIAVIVLCFSGYKLFSIYTDYHEAAEEYDEIAGEVTGETEDGEFTVDFEELQSRNPDCIGWIRFINVDISYPIMQGDDNEYYLKHTFTGQERTSASIFMDYQNTSDFSDMVTIIYGHNMKNDTMFGNLHEYEDSSTLETDPYFLIYTPDGTYRYDIFSCYTTSDLNYQIFYSESDEYTEYVQKLKNNSSYDTGVEVSGSDHIIMLSTCTAAGDNYRYVVCGVLAEQIE